MLRQWLRQLNGSPEDLYRVLRQFDWDLGGPAEMVHLGSGMYSYKSEPLKIEHIAAVIVKTESEEVRHRLLTAYSKELWRAAGRRNDRRSPATT